MQQMIIDWARCSIQRCAACSLPWSAGANQREDGLKLSNTLNSTSARMPLAKLERNSLACSVYDARVVTLSLAATVDECTEDLKWCLSDRSAIYASHEPQSLAVLNQEQVDKKLTRTLSTIDGRSRLFSKLGESERGRT